MKKARTVLVLAAIAVLLLLLVFTVQAKDAAISALKLCGMTLIPSLFPFYAAANLLVNTGPLRTGKRTAALMERLFCLPGEAAPALLLGLLGGYPIGAATTAGLYRQGVLSKDEAVRLSCFSNNAGPAFIIGAAGLAVFHSTAVGLLLYFIHVVSAILTGIVRYRGKKPAITVQKITQQESQSISHALPTAISSATKSMLMICAYVVFFSVVLTLLKQLSPIAYAIRSLSTLLPTAEALFNGLTELSCGIVSLRGCPEDAALVATSVLLGWGGFCVCFQSAAVLSDAGLPATQCLRGKLLQAAFAGALTCLYCIVRTFRVRFLLEFILFTLLLLCLVKIRGRKKQYRLI